MALSAVTTQSAFPVRAVWIIGLSPGSALTYETHIMVSGTTFIAQLPNGLVDVVVGQAGVMKRSRRLRPLLVPCLLVEFIEQSEQLVALRVRHSSYDRHDFFDGWHVWSSF